MTTVTLNATKAAIRSTPAVFEVTLMVGVLVAGGLLVDELVSPQPGSHGSFTSLSEPMRAALTASGYAALATALGALPVLLVRQVSQCAQDLMLGFAAGVMLAASAFSLIVPSIETGTAILGGKSSAALLAALGIATGALLMLGIDRVLPHEHPHAGRAGPASRINRVWLLVIAILIHNFPEGMAIGAAFSGVDAAAGVPVATAIAIQDIPEGLVVALALCTIGFPAWKAALVAAATGLAEPLGAAAASAVLGTVPTLHPFGLALAAGAMLFVVSHEIIPETHRNGHQLAATLGVIGGFAVMMVLDNALT